MKFLPRAAVTVFAMSAVTALIGVSAASAAPYPPRSKAVLYVSTTRPYAGARIEVSGAHFAAHDTITIRLAGIVLGRSVADASGSFDPPVTVPSTLLGTQTLTGTAEPSGYTASLSLTVTAPSTTTTTSSGLPFTGADVLGLLGVAVLLVAAGALTLVSGRRRRAHAA